MVPFHSLSYCEISSHFLGIFDLTNASYISLPVYISVYFSIYISYKKAGWVIILGVHSTSGWHAIYFKMTFRVKFHSQALEHGASLHLFWWESPDFIVFTFTCLRWFFFNYFFYIFTLHHAHCMTSWSSPPKILPPSPMPLFSESVAYTPLTLPTILRV